MAISSPLDLSGCQLWVKADAGVYKDAGVTPCADGDLVQQWNDQSGNGNHLTAGTKPTFHTSQQGGLPGVVFNGSNTYLNCPFTGEPQTVVAIYYPTTVTGYQDILAADTSDAVAVGGYYFQSANNGSRTAFIRATTADSGATGDLQINLTGTAHAGRVVILSGRLDTSATKTIRARYRDTVQGDGSDTSTNALRPIINPLVGAGWFNSARTDWFNGKLFELAVYDRVLSDLELTQLEYYLWRRWGLGAAPPVNYLMACFGAVSGDDTGSTESLDILESQDGITWSNRPVYYAPNGAATVRDPSIMRRNGVWWVAHTSGSLGASSSFDICSSTDSGVTFDYVASVDCSAVTGANRVWAPEWFIDPDDGSVHIIVTISTNAGSSFTLYEVHPTSADFTAWSAPQAITGTGFPGAPIDPYMVKIGSTYYLWLRSETGGAGDDLEVFTSSSLTSGYSALHTGNWLGFGDNVAEGPSVLLLADGKTWRVYADRFNAGTGIAYSTQTAGDWTSGGSTTWAALANIAFTDGGSFVSRHGTVLQLEPSLDWFRPLELPRNPAVEMVPY